MRVRAADASEAAALSALALRSKGHWGYDDEFLAACRDELTLQPHELTAYVTRVVDDAGRARGFYQLRPVDDDDGALELELFYIDPDNIGQGLGRLLWDDLQAQLRRLSARWLRIESDPDARGFYEAMGARLIGEAPSGSIPDRMLPLLRFDVPDPGASPRAQVS